jgi:hypothetical protein
MILHRKRSGMAIVAVFSLILTLASAMNARAAVATPTRPIAQGAAGSGASTGTSPMDVGRCTPSHLCTLTVAATPWLCLDADISHGDYNGMKAQLWNCNGWGNQKWYAVTVFEADFTLRSARNGKCLDVDLTHINENGAKVQLWDCLGPYQYNQQWRYSTGTVGDTWTGIIQNVQSEKVLDADANCLCNGGKVQQWDWIYPRTNQQWRLNQE